MNSSRNDFINIVRLLLQTISTAIAIFGILIAFKYVMLRPSIEVTVKEFPSPYYAANLLLDFYTANNIEIPNDILDDPILSRSLKKHDDGLDSLAAGKSYIETARFFEKHDVAIDNFLFDRLEERFDSIDFKTRFYTSSSGTVFPQERLDNLKKHAKENLSRKSYFLYLISLLSIRIVPQTIFVKNNGEVDLNNVEIRISAPVKSLDFKREGAIVDFQMHDSTPFQVENVSDELIIHKKVLKVGQFFSVEVKTKENHLQKDEIYSSFESAQVLDKKSSIKYGIWIACGIVLIYVFVGAGVLLEKSKRQ